MQGSGHAMANRRWRRGHLAEKATDIDIRNDSQAADPGGIFGDQIQEAASATAC